MRLATVLLMHAAGIASAQSTPAFEVASVKINKAGDSGPSKISSSIPGRFIVTNTPLRFLILHAYHLLDHQLISLPDWTSDLSVDITASYAPGSTPTDSEIRVMLQKLLAERFDLATHHEQRELTSYTLVVAREGRLGPRLHPSGVDCQKWIAEKKPQTDAGGQSPVTPSGKRPACMMLATRRWLSGGTRTMPQLAATLQSMLGKPVIDQTGLSGGFDVDLQWTPDAADARSGDTPANDGPSIFSAVQEQLGLRLATKRDRVDVVVVDRVARPTPN
jgi:uncharacterized protein (TIGR03435 family)